ncbi:hypothetical protein TWF173_006008 [Orbilia oligospora]|nr:hypothetical protein TWF173_006008 [Orbilia oligospora]
MRVSLLLPVASAAFAAASFIVIPDEQTIKLVASNRHHQAPITSDDKQKVVEPEKPRHDGGPPHEHHGHHCDVLHPQYILRERYAERSRLHHRVPGFDLDTIEGFSCIELEGHTENLPKVLMGYHTQGHAQDHILDHTRVRVEVRVEVRLGARAYHPTKVHMEVRTRDPVDVLMTEKSLHAGVHHQESQGSQGSLAIDHHHIGGRHDEGLANLEKIHHHGHQSLQAILMIFHDSHQTGHRSRSRSRVGQSNHTTKFASIVSEHEDLVAVLNSTIANYTLFVPTNEAFKKFKNAPKDWKPPKDVIKRFLTYHISNGAYPVFKLLLGHTIASALDGGELGGNQRIRVALGPGGLSVNFYSHVVAGNIFATNGVIHAVDAVLFPPPPAGSIIHFFPSEFSTFLLAAHLTNLTDEIPHEHTGGTLFAPPNSAFQKLGPKINAFLFSPWGRKYLKALLKYHIVVNETLYSDAYYHPTSKAGVKPQDIPRGHYHVDLPTLLENKHLSIDISRFGGLITILINAQSTVKIQDVIAKDGVIQIVENVLVPPKKPPTGDSAQEIEEFENAEELENTMGMTVEQFRERFEGLVEDDGVTGEYNEEDVLNMWKH